MSFSLKKKIITSTYTLNNQPIPSVISHSDIGTTFDCNLTFQDHIKSVVNKAMAVVGILYRLNEVSEPCALKSVFIGCVQPILEYCSPIWSTASPTTLKLLNRPLNFFIAIVRHRIPHLRLSSREEILNSLGLLHPTHRRLTSDLKFLHCIMNGSFRCSDLLSFFSLHIPARTTRNTKTLHQPKFRLSISQRSLFYRLPSLFNSLTNTISSLDLFASRTTFNSQLKSLSF